MLVFSLDNESGKPLYQQIYEYIKEEIRDVFLTGKNYLRQENWRPLFS